MFNQNLFNTQLFNTGDVVEQSPINWIQYNGYVFENWFRISNITGLDDDADFEINTYTRANADGMGIDSIYARKKERTVQGILSSDTPGGLDTAIDQLKATILQRNKYFYYIRRDGTVVRTIANVQKITIDRKYYHITFVPVTIKFISVDPFFYNVNDTEVSFYGQTADLNASLLYSGGNAYTYPLIALTFNSATSVTAITITIDWVALSITDTITAGDSIIIDCKQKTIFKNSITPVNYSGLFPKLDRWEKPFLVDINGTFNVDIFASWYDSYA